MPGPQPRGAPDLRPARQRQYRVRTGGKTASKAQKRRYLERFRTLADDPERVVPEWRGKKRDPFRRLRKRLAKVKKKYEAGKKLKRKAKKRRVDGAYAGALSVLSKGDFKAFAVIPTAHGEVRFVPRGRAKPYHQAAVQNFERPEVLLIGYVDKKWRRKAAFWALEDRLVATEPGTAPPDGFLRVLFGDAKVPLAADDGAAMCAHAADDRFHVVVRPEGVAVEFRVCASCLGKMGDRVGAWLGRRHVGPAKATDIDLGLGGWPWQPANPEDEQALAALVADADEATRQHARGYREYTNREFLDWGRQRIDEALDARDGGFLLVGDRIWLSGYERAVDDLLTADGERRLAKAAFRTQTPRIRTSEASVQKLVGPAWVDGAEAIVREAAGETLRAEQARDLAAGDPVTAAAQLGRYEEAAERLRAYPRFDTKGAPAALRLALQVARTWHGVGPEAARDRIRGAVTEGGLKVMAYALAQAAEATSGMGWRFTPDEKRKADFLAPYAAALLEAEPEAYAGAVEQLAAALGVPPPPEHG